MQSDATWFNMLVFATGDPGSLTPAVRRAIQSLDPNISLRR
jgi:hypothetical protein